MSVFIEITNEELYQRLVKGVELKGLKGENSTERGDVFDGPIQIFTNDDRVRPWFGFLEADAFEDQYGFMLKFVKDEESSELQLENYTPLLA